MTSSAGEAESGDSFQVLGEKTVASPGGKEATWLKITPPAGEYRWIHLRDVSRQEPVELPAPVTLATVTEPPEPEPMEREPRRIEPTQASRLSDSWNCRQSPAQ